VAKCRKLQSAPYWDSACKRLFLDVISQLNKMPGDFPPPRANSVLNHVSPFQPDPQISDHARGKTTLAIRVLIADELEVMRRGLCTVVQTRPDWKVCAEAGDGREALEQSDRLKPDIAILDIGLPLMDGIETARQIVKASPGTKILILTSDYSDDVVREALKAGAHGLLLKADAVRDLGYAIDALLQGQTYLSSKIEARVLARSLNRRPDQNASPESHLTPREREVVRLLVDGKSAKEVAAALGLSVKTVETHRSNVMRKLQIHSVSELVLYAVRTNIIRAAS
jgi:DNA-binding NarL/FixJ family response regulator